MANKSTILIIDDEKDIRESLSEILLDEGYETYLAADANEARELIKQENNIDIILFSYADYSRRNVQTPFNRTNKIF